MRLSFTKMHGLGNDFILIDGINHPLPDFNRYAKFLCDRRFGIGCDQLLLLLNSTKADLRMQIFNADGSEVEMCGNGIRCFALYAKKHGLMPDQILNVETLGGIKTIRILGDQIEVDMGEPMLLGPDIPIAFEGKVIAKKVSFDGVSYSITAVGMGNPHVILFVDHVQDAPVETLGRRIESDPLFPKRTNVEFVEIVDKKHLNVRVWERGAGITLACGTGASAALVAAVLNGFSDREAAVDLPGGRLEIRWSEKDNHVYMKGPGVEVFEGSIEIPDLQTL